jgi:hypothetical protein
MRRIICALFLLAALSGCESRHHATSPATLCACQRQGCEKCRGHRCGNDCHGKDCCPCPAPAPFKQPTIRVP